MIKRTAFVFLILLLTVNSVLAIRPRSGEWIFNANGKILGLNIPASISLTFHVLLEGESWGDNCWRTTIAGGTVAVSKVFIQIKISGDIISITEVPPISTISPDFNFVGVLDSTTSAHGTEAFFHATIGLSRYLVSNVTWEAKWKSTGTKQPPTLLDIPDQTTIGKTFAPVKLDDYVSDPDNDDSEITWTYSGNNSLLVSIDANRVATIATPNPEWSGSEIITFTAKDPDGLSESDSAKFTVIMLGDVNNNGKIQSDDAILTLRISVGLLEPSYYQKRAADMNGDGKIRSDDAIAILRKAVGFAAPQVLVSVQKPVKISLSEINGVKGENITLPVKVDSIDFLSGGDIRITYDSTVLRATELINGSDTNICLVSNLAQTGLVCIAFASADKMVSTKLAEIRFEVLSDNISPLKLESVELYDFSIQPLPTKIINGEFISWAMPPDHSELLQNFPNPFNPETWIPYQLKDVSEVTIRIYDLSGKLLRELNLGDKTAGLYISRDRAAYWDGRNDTGELVSSGVYFYSINAGSYNAIRKMIIMR